MASYNLFTYFLKFVMSIPGMIGYESTTGRLINEVELTRYKV
jgi:hypothetical protein